MPLILGSQSPHRRELLGYFNVPFVQIPSAFDEKEVVFQGDPKEYVQTLAEQKGRDLKQRHAKEVILTADTVVFLQGKIYNKPESAQQAFAMLKDLSGRWHSVFTAVSVQGEALHSEVQETRVLFHSLTDTQIDFYLKNSHFLDKAGSYTIQQAGGLLIEQIIGCYYNVLGLPLSATRAVLLKAGIDLWQHLKPF